MFGAGISASLLRQRVVLHPDRVTSEADRPTPRQFGKPAGRRDEPLAVPRDDEAVRIPDDRVVKRPGSEARGPSNAEYGSARIDRRYGLAGLRIDFERDVAPVGQRAATSRVRHDGEGRRRHDRLGAGVGATRQNETQDNKQPVATTVGASQLPNPDSKLNQIRMNVLPKASSMYIALEKHMRRSPSIGANSEMKPAAADPLKTGPPLSPTCAVF